jgi:hypothetical protein
MCNAKSGFVECCLNGTIYREVADAVAGTYTRKTPGRSTGKGMMMLLMNWDTGSWHQWNGARTKYQAIQRRWPDAIRRLEVLKAYHDQRLGVSLMREEAEMVIDRIAGDLLNYDLPFLTAHDGIYVPRKYGEAVKNKMEDHYNRVYGRSPNITIE